MLRSNDPPFMDFDQFSLRSYSAREVQKLSVLKVYQTKTFDALGHPIEGGLYDLKLGPVNDHEKCVTCNLNGKFCPGHLGYLSLEVPVFNPVHFPFMFNLLKGTCVNCHRFMCKTDGPTTKILLAQLRCIELGVTEIAEALGMSIKEKLQNAENKADVENLLEKFAKFNMDEIDQVIKDYTGKSIDELDKASGISAKNEVDFRRSLMKEYMKAHLFKHRVKCPLCKRRNGAFRNDSHRAILLDFGAQGIHGKASMRGGGRLSDLGDSKLIGDTGPIEEYLDEIDKEKSVALGFLKKENPLKMQLEAIQSGRCTKLIWRAAEVREHFRYVWKNNGDVLKKLFSLFSNEEDDVCPMDILFYETLIVPPNKFRPIRMFQGEQFEDPQTVSFRRIMETNQLIRYAKASVNETGEIIGDAEFNATAESKLGSGSMVEKLHRVYVDLQLKVNCLYDSDLNKTEQRPVPGIRQLLEKKQGLFRMNMMGKRVNYACRSVITPDPYLDVDEIGIPEIFAKKLTFNEMPNAMNLAKLRELVKAGPGVYPGANFVITEKGWKTNLLAGAQHSEDREREARLLRIPSAFNPEKEKTPFESSTVLRHLQRGEMVLMNRQPSLHKPSIMGHRVRILKSQRALRMNYAPCKAYNADFDGDEMNGHFIQNHIGQVEAAELADVGSSYLVPKDGTPILGLIQDHVVSGVLLTVRDTFLEKHEIVQLLLASFSQTTQRLHLPPPAIHHPRKLWTGKQVVTAIVQNCSPKKAHLINLKGKAKTSLSCWKVDGYPAPKLEMSESEVIFSRGALVSGVLDKAHFGATQYGLIHCCFELYGHKVATRIMSCFSRCFTTYLQSHGFSLGVADILVKDKADKARTECIKQLRQQGDDIVKKTFNLPDDASRIQIKHALAKSYNNARGETADVKLYDYSVKQAIGKYNDKINEACVPEGLIRRFPQNSLQLMIQSGAKGSSVNAIQISCALGQIELEGQRPPLSSTGRTLPSFWQFDTSPRAGGFVDQRFLTGINPQELFFHTMAGREGLIDTAVKTSRSGYLQRCIIKHLEGITVQYDGTVRDHDGSVIQFRYGEDGFDVGRATFLNPKQFPFLLRNTKALRDSCIPKKLFHSDFNLDEATRKYRQIRRRRKKYAAAATKNPFGGRVFSSGFVEFSSLFKGQPKADIQDKWFALTQQDRDEYKAIAIVIPDAVDVQFNPYVTLGALPEKTLDQIDEFYKTEGNKNENFLRALYWKGFRSYVEPGENVGLLAAQSIGEPSTQMTLNTFHFAGRGEMNVTLGIPRLREILMTSGENISTPTAEVNIRQIATVDDIEMLKQVFNRVYLKNCLKKVTVKELIDVNSAGAYRLYEVGIELLPSKSREAFARHLTRKRILQRMEQTFGGSVCRMLNLKLRNAGDFVAITRKKASTSFAREAGGGDDVPRRRSNDDGMSSDEEVNDGAEDANEARLRNRHMDDAAEYEGEEVEEVEIQPGKDDMLASFTAIADGEDVDEEENDDDDVNVSATGENGTDAPKDATDILRRTNVMESGNSMLVDYQFDSKNNRWCFYKFQIPLDRHQLDVNSIIYSCIDSCIVHETPNVEKCVIREDDKNDKNVKILQTQGINLETFYKHANLLDINTIYSNDVTLMLRTYGIEACQRSIVREMNNVFGVYGIDVNPRHLTLVSDYMTFTGRIAPFSRGAMASSTSSLQKMTFETTMNFMRDALILGEIDHINSPSSRIVTGQLLKGGTGCFQLYQNPSYALGLGSYGVQQAKISRWQRINFDDAIDSE